MSHSVHLKPCRARGLSLGPSSRRYHAPWKMRPQKKRNLAADVTLSSLSTQGGLIMTKRPRSATTRSVPAQTPEQLLELAQDHIRPLIGVIDQLNEADAEDELRVISKQLTRLSFRVQPLSSGK